MFQSHRVLLLTRTHEAGHPTHLPRPNVTNSCQLSTPRNHFVYITFEKQAGKTRVGAKRARWRRVHGHVSLQLGPALRSHGFRPLSLSRSGVSCSRADNESVNESCRQGSFCATRRTLELTHLQFDPRPSNLNPYRRLRQSGPCRPDGKNHAPHEMQSHLCCSIICSKSQCAHDEDLPLAPTFPLKEATNHGCARTGPFLQRPPVSTQDSHRERDRKKEKKATSRRRRLDHTKSLQWSGRCEVLLQLKVTAVLVRITFVVRDHISVLFQGYVSKGCATVPTLAHSLCDIGGQQCLPPL